MPASFTPSVDNGSVRAIAQVGATMVIGGNFTSVNGQTRNGLAAFNATTGALTSWAPSTNGLVMSLVPGNDGHSVYAAGEFTMVNGAAAQYVTLLDLNTGQPEPQFRQPTFNFGRVADVSLVGNRLYIAGSFTRVNGVAHGGLASLNATTGALDPFMGVNVTGHHNDTGNGAQGAVGPWNIDVSPDGRTMVAIGNFKYADGLLRDQVVRIDLSGAQAVVDPNWATNRYSPQCFNWAFDSDVRGVSFSPDGSYFVITATGGGNPGTLCDAVTRWNTSDTGTNVQPAWVDETGGDTVWGVAVTDDAIFVGGHNRWMNDPLGVDSPGAGAVPRPGLEALDPVSGRPLSWNPGHVPLGVAVYAFLATKQGLWMGWDSGYIGNYKYHRPRIALFPYAGGTTLASTTTGTLPGTVYLGGSQGTGASNVLYRVDAGGPAVQSLDGGPDWDADTSANPSQYHNSGSNTADYSPISRLDASVPASTPPQIFDHERWSPSDLPAMDWNFPVTAGTHVEVRLYFANRYTGTGEPGQREFNVDVDGRRVLSNYDIVADVGDQTGEMKAFDVTVPSDGNVEVTFTHSVENPLINGIEVVNLDQQKRQARKGLVRSHAQPLADTVTGVPFDGATAGSPQTLDGGGVPWSQSHGAFMVGNQVFYGGADGYLYDTTFDGRTFTAPVQVNPYHDPAWKDVQTGDGQTFDGNLPQFYGQIPNVTGMFYSAGKLYFTLLGDSALHWAWFSPDSGIVDQTESTATSSVSFSDADGMFASGNKLYFVKKSDGAMYSVDFTGGVVSGTPTLVNGPGNGGINWRNRSLFFMQATAVNQPPTASFTSQCSGLRCSFDASASNDPDGTITSYAWNFGDGTQGTGVSPSHSYTTAGQFTVTLTVTDNDNATATASHDVQTSVPSSNIAFVGTTHSGPGSSKYKQVTVPPDAQPGDTMLMWFSQPSSATRTGPTGVTGWTQVDDYTNGSLRTTVWEKQVASGDPGAAVRFDFPAAQHAMLSLADYSGVDSVTPIADLSHAGDTNATDHVTPNVAARLGSWVVSYWTDRGATSSWTAPSGVTVRDTGLDTGNVGSFTSELADTDGPVGAGQYGGLTASTNVASTAANVYSVALNTASGDGVNAPPTAAFSWQCTGLSCTFDGSGSHDSDGTITSYGWDFGDDGHDSGVSKTHTFAASGEYSVTLTVTDNDDATDTVTHVVSVSVPGEVDFAAAVHSASGSSKFKQVTVPAAAQVGDTMLLFFSQAADAARTGPSGVTGWTQIDDFVNGTLRTTVWEKQVAVGDLGTAVRFDFPAAQHASLTLADYLGVDPTNPVTAVGHAGDVRSANHVSPTVTAGDGDWVVTYWTDRGTTTAWTAPDQVTVRDTGTDTGAGGLFTSLLVDSANAVGGGSYGALTASTDVASARADMLTIALHPKAA